MPTKTNFEQALDAYNIRDFETAIKLFSLEAQQGDTNSEAYVILSLFNLAADTSLRASRSNSQEELVKGQQKAVNLTDACIRACLNFLRRNYEDRENSDLAAFMISRSFSLQYALVAAGLTTAYRITSTTTHITRHMLNGETLWEEITGTDSDEFISLYSYDWSEYSLFGPDRRTVRVEQAKETVLQNAVQVATILTYMGRDYDAMLVRAVVAGEMADCENGIRSMLLSADWFVAMAMQLAAEQMDDAQYQAWSEMNDITFTELAEYRNKYAALLRQMQREGMRPYLNRFFQDPAEVPKIEDCVVYTQYQKNPGAGDVANPNTKVKGEGFQLFLSIFAQASNQKAIPMIVFASAIGLLFGGLFNVFNPDAGIFAKVFIIVFGILTVILTLIRTAKDMDNIVGKGSRRLFMLTRFGIALVFAINFFFGLIVFIILKILSKRYR